VSGTIAALSFPAWKAFERDVIPPEQLDGAIALFGSLAAAAALIGAVAGGFLLGVIGASAVFALNAASFVPQMVVIAHLHPKERPPQPPTHHDLRRALRVIRTDPKLRLGFRSLIAVSLLAAPLFKLLPAIAEQVDDGAHILGLLTAMVSLGGMAVAGAMVRLRRRYGRGLVVMMGMLVAATAMIALGISNVFLDGYALFPPVIAALIILGLSVGLADAALSSLVTSDAPEELEGSIFAVYAIVFMAIGPVGAVILAQVSEHIDVYVLMAICGVVLMLLGLADRHPGGEPSTGDASVSTFGGLLLHGILHREVDLHPHHRGAGIRSR
jgi:MFS family permease